MTIEKYFQEGHGILLQNAERMFCRSIRTNPSLEAVCHFGSSLRKKDPKDVDFFIVSDSEKLFYQAEEWREWSCFPRFILFQPDFFFRMGTSLDSESVQSIRIGEDSPDGKIMENLKNGEKCVIYTRSENVLKYRREFPGSFVCYVED